MNTIEIHTTLQLLIDQTRESLAGLEENEFIPSVNLRDILADFWDEWFNPILEVLVARQDVRF